MISANKDTLTGGSGGENERVGRIPNWEQKFHPALLSAGASTVRPVHPQGPSTDSCHSPVKLLDSSHTASPPSAHE